MPPTTDIDLEARDQIGNLSLLLTDPDGSRSQMTKAMRKGIRTARSQSNLDLIRDLINKKYAICIDWKLN